MYNGSEKRECKRIKQPFVVKVRKKIGRRREDNTGWNIVTAQNLGASGALLNDNRKHEVGSLLELEINFPMISDPISCVAMVNRVEENPYSPIMRFATVFTEIDENARELINRLAERFDISKPERIESGY